MLNRIIVFLSFVCMISSFYLPYVQFAGFFQSGSNLVFGTPLSLQVKAILLLAPLTGIGGLLIFFLKKKSIMYLLLVFISLGLHVAYLYYNLNFIHSYTKISSFTLDALQSLSGVIGLGIVFQAIAFFLVLVFGIKDPVGKKK